MYFVSNRCWFHLFPGDWSWFQLVSGGFSSLQFVHHFSMYKFGHPKITYILSFAYPTVLRKVSVVGVILVCIFYAFWLNTGKCGKNADQNNSDYRHFSRSVMDTVLILHITGPLNQLSRKGKVKKKGLV